MSLADECTQVVASSSEVKEMLLGFVAKVPLAARSGWFAAVCIASFSGSEGKWCIQERR